MCNGVTTWSLASFAYYTSTLMMFWDWWHLLQRGSRLGIAWIFTEEIGRVWVVKLSGLLQIFLLSSSSLSWALNLFPPLKKTALQFSIMFLFTFSWKEVKNSLIEGLFVSSEWSHGTQNSPLHSYAHSKSIAWSELTHFFFFLILLPYITYQLRFPYLYSF